MHNINPNSELPKLSVIMVVRNAVSTIERALNSLIAQHYPNLEFIVWDGQSTDGTLKVLGHYSNIISVIKSEKDNGSADGCNKAVALATGDYVGFLYADDVYEPGTLWAVAESILAQPESDVVSFGMIYRKKDKQGHDVVTGYYAHESQLELTLEKVLSDLPTFVLSRFYRHGLFGPLNTNYIANDRELIAQLALKKCKNTIIPRALYGFVMHDAGISSNPDNYIRIMKEHSAMATDLLARNDLSDAERNVVKEWQKRQFVFGFWQALAKQRWNQAGEFMREGIALGGPGFILLALCVLIKKMLKRLGLKLSGGIDRGAV